MKVDTSKLKKSSSELSLECRQLIENISKCRTKAELLEFLSTINVWIYGKCELFHWIEILDRFDKILEEEAKIINGNEYVLYCDVNSSDDDVKLLILVLNFTTLLIEHSFSRHLYNSVEHLTRLLSSQNMDVVLAVLNLLYMFSKRSNFIPRLQFERKEMLLIKLFNIAERWGDPNYGLSLYDCCLREPKTEFLYQLSIDYIDESGMQAILEIPDMMYLCKKTPPAEVYKNICNQISNPSDAIKMRIAHRIRLVCGFKDIKLRLQFVQARLQAVSILIYSNAIQENLDKVLYPGFGEELCEIIDKKEKHLLEIRAAVLRTLTSMLHFDRNPNIPRPGSRLGKIIQYTGADRQGGILPLLVKDCINSLIKESVCSNYPLILATSLFSLLYHLASYEAGGQALVKSGMMQSLLSVISWSGIDLEHITFVTRAVRVIDLITNIDIAKFHQNNGLNIFIDRLEKEINICRETLADVQSSDNLSAPEDDQEKMDDDIESVNDLSPDDGTQNSSEIAGQFGEYDGSLEFPVNYEYHSEGANCSSQNQAPQANDASDASCSTSKIKHACLTQRAALLKSMLNFLKKSIQDHTHFNGMRNIMETSLPSSLRHIISNAEYYGPSLFLLATDVVTVYVFNEPSLLSSLQDLGLTKVMLQSLLQKDVPATREVLGSLPNVFSALCLNERGLMEFMSYKPFDKLLKVLLSPDYLIAMRRRRSSDPLGDTATNLGNAMDDLMKHHPYLRNDAIEAIVRLLNELVRLGTDSNYVCWRSNKDNLASSNNSANTTNEARNSANEAETTHNDSSGDDDDDEEEISSASQQQRQNHNLVRSQQNLMLLSKVVERESIPLIDFILNVMKFVEAIFNNSSNGNNDHCREFVVHGGLKPLLQLLSLPNLPVDSPVSTTAQAVANVCKSIFNIAHETKVIDLALQHMLKIIENLQPLVIQPNFANGSILLKEFVSCPKLEDGFSNAEYTPLLHRMSSVHGYVIMLVHLCRNATNEMRIVLLKRWGTNVQNGLNLLKSLVQLYISLVWESTILLSLCSEEQNHEQLWADIVNKSCEQQTTEEKNSSKSLEKQLINAKLKIKPEEQLRYIKSLLAASSRLGRALAELFGTLVKLAVGTPQSKQRRNNDFIATAGSSKYPTADARQIAKVLSSILVNGFQHENAFPKPPPKLKLTFLICSVGFTVPMLFDDKRNSFHLMISQFCEENGLQAFFNMFFWALYLNDEEKSKFSFEKCLTMENILEDSEDDDKDFPEGTGEFLDAWLQLLEKMVNPRATLDSPYAIFARFPHQERDGLNFESVFYLIQVHQIALQCIRRIWKRKPLSNYGLSMTETTITILKHLIKSFGNLKERYHVRVTELNNKMQDENLRALQMNTHEINVNPDYLKILIDMGFVRSHVIEALLHTRSLEQATEYLLNHPEASIGSTVDESSTTAQDSNTAMEVDAAPNAPKTEGGAAAASTSGGSGSTSSPEEANRSKESGNFFKNIKLIPDEIFEKFCEEALERVLTLLEYLPESVNPGTELISILYRRQTISNKNNFVNNLIKSITKMVEDVVRKISLNSSNDSKTEEEEDQYISGPASMKLFIRLKVSNLLLDEIYSDMRKEICNTLLWERSIESYLSLLKLTEEKLYRQFLKGAKPKVPCWLHPLVEFIDSIDNVSLIMQRRLNMRSVCSENWKWYDSSTGKWNSYSESHNALLKNAFNLGERSLALSNGRQRYTINFNSMTQVNEASGSHRIILPSLKITDAMGSVSNGSCKFDTIVTRIFKSKFETNAGEFDEEIVNLQSLMKFSEDSSKDLNSSSSKDEGSSETQEPQNVTVINLYNSDKNDASSNSNKQTQTQTSDNKNPSKPAIHSKRSQKIVVSEEPVGLASYDTKNIISSLVRLLDPNCQVPSDVKISIMKLCARLTRDYKNAKIFYKCGGLGILLNMQQTCSIMGFPTFAIIIIRHLLESPFVLQESIERILTLRTSQHIPVGHRDVTFVLMQMSSAVSRNPSIFFDAAKQVLKADHVMRPTFAIDDYRLLVKSNANKKNDTASSSSSASSPNHKSRPNDISHTSRETIKDLLMAIVRPCIHYGGISSTDEQIQSLTSEAHNETDPSSSGNSLNSKKIAEKFEPCCCSWHMPSSGHIHLKPILPRATILKILADCVRSYQSLVPQILVDHVYTPAHSILINKEQSFLAFILDNFLPIIRRQQDSEVSVMSRVLIISLSDCYNYPAIQSKVVEEIQEAIKRALMKTDSTEKHTRLQILVGLLPSMIESPMLTSKIQIQRNNMYRVLLKHDIMTYLAKLVQYKDLSNYNSLNTINVILRPMEILLRLAAGPGNMGTKRIFFHANSHGNLTRRIYPRLLARSTTTDHSGGSEHVLRDIIRNVLTDRRHAFDFVFTPEEMFMDSDDTIPSSRNAAMELTDSRIDHTDPLPTSNNRPTLNFDRLWDDLMQSEGLRISNLNPNTNNSSTHNNSDRHSTNHDEVSRNNDNVGGGGSDGASTSSETVPNVAENSTSLLGDVSTSESDSDSNISTENEERNDDEEEENDEEANDEDEEDRSETDGDDETRQFIEVFDHIYEPESSETASNDADVDGDDDNSEISVNNRMSNNSEMGQDANSTSTHGQSHDNEGLAENPMVLDRPNLSEGAPLEPTFNVLLANHPNDATPSSSLGSVNTTPVSQWVPSRLTFGVDGHISFSNSELVSTHDPPTINTENEQALIQTNHNNVELNSQTNSATQRRDGNRRLVFLDQQYCAPMPTYTCPTEESQIELFNQDALHWWFEESKHLELESQADACLYVAHRLVPNLIKELKENFLRDSKLKKSSDTAVNAGNLSTNSRRSAIPVLIQHSAGSLSAPNISSENEDTQSISARSQVPVNLVDMDTSSFASATTNDESQDYTQDFPENSSAQLDSVPEVEDLVAASNDNAGNVEVMENENIESSETTENTENVNVEASGVASSQDTPPPVESEMPSANDTNNAEAPSVPEPPETPAAASTNDLATNDLMNEASSEGAAANVPEAQAAAVTAAASEESPSASGAEGNTTNTVQEISPEIRAALGDLEVPEGVDPSFLAALPQEMREEVIQEHLRMVRIRQRDQQTAVQASNENVLEVNPEFLAALPPNLQSEVLLQQRLEQQRQAAQTANPEDPVDTAAFFQNLPEALRQAILTDMEDSQIATLPPDLAAEAQYLRRDWENRNGSRVGTLRFPASLQNFGDESRLYSNSIWYDASAPSHSHHQHTSILHPGQHNQGKPIALVLMEDENNLLDPDSIATLLLFLCIEDPKMNFGRLHRVIRNLCFHLPTREWIISALMNIIQKTNEGQLEYNFHKDMKPKWLRMCVDAAFGYKANIFVINKKMPSSGKSDECEYTININPQAAQMIVRNCLDMLFVLAKHFAKSFLPCNKEKDNKNKGGKLSEMGSSSGNNETIEPIPLALTMNSSNNADIGTADFSSDELRALFYRQQHDPRRPPISNFDLIRGIDEHQSHSTSKASARPSTSSKPSVKNKNPKIAYNTNSKNFWDVLLQIDLNTPTRVSNMQQFPILCHPPWEWKAKNQDFIAFSESPFATLLEMLPYKVICRSPNLTDSLVKLLASLSSDLPKEEDIVEPPLLGEAAGAGKPPSSGDNNQPSQTSSQSTKETDPGGLKQPSKNLNVDNSSNNTKKRRIYSKNFSHLQLIIEVLTHQCGTAEGLEYVSKLIVNLSQCSPAFNAIFIEYLISAINGLAHDVRSRIQTLLNEIRVYNEKNDKAAPSNSKAPYFVTQTNQLVMEDRFSAGHVIISAPKNAKPTCELQLPAMKTLLSPSSAQLYFLRTLKIFIQIRDIFNAQNQDLTTVNPTLSQIICLDDLWDTLSECLKALEESKDEYAVLVLQPTVEAFFLIHASSKKTNRKSNVRNSNSNVSTEENNLNTLEEDSISNASPNASPNPSSSGPAATNSDSSLAAAATTAASVSGAAAGTSPTAGAGASDGVDAAASSGEKVQLSSREEQLKQDRLKFLNFAEKHRTVLNQILRQSTTHLSDGPFAVLVDHTRILDFDVKRKYFQTELERIDEGVRREEHTVSVRRVTVFEDSFRVLYRLGPEEWKNRFYIVFEDEEGQDAGGLLREWYVIISREIFNPMYALFCVSPGDRVTYMINPSSHANPNHLSYFKFVGRVIAKAVHDNKLLECYFTRSFYKHILGKQVKYTDMESQDYEFYKGLDYLMKNDISTLGYELTFSTEVQEFGVTQVRDLIPNGRNIPVTEENKFEYVNLVCQLKMSGSIRQQLDAFLEGFYDIIPKHLISIFNEQELELLISGLPDIDIEDLKANTEYHKYTSKSVQIQWFWRALRSFDQADRAKFLQFVTGTSKVPLQGFGSLEGMNGIQKFQIHRDDRSTDRLPCAHTCFNQLDLPMYKSYEKLRSCLLKAIHECSEGFGFA